MKAWLTGLIAVLVGNTWAATATDMDVCVSFGCAEQRQALLTADDWARLRTLFDGVADAATERTAVARAIALFEARIGQQTETWQDKAKNWQRAGEPGELDCIAESTNTDRYLKALTEAGLLRWHHVVDRERRGLFFVHWTAVLQQQDDGRHWAVDSWFRDNGEPPVILPLADWHAYKEPGE